MLYNKLWLWILRPHSDCVGNNSCCQDECFIHCNGLWSNKLDLHLRTFITTGTGFQLPSLVFVFPGVKHINIHDDSGQFLLDRLRPSFNCRRDKYIKEHSEMVRQCYILNNNKMFIPLLISRSRVCPRLCVGPCTGWVRSKVFKTVMIYFLILVSGLSMWIY